MRSTALMLAVVSLALALPAGASNSRESRRLTIQLISTPGQLRFTDVAPKAPANWVVLSRGDRMSGTSILSNGAAQFGKPKGAVVGSDAFLMLAQSRSHVQMSVKVTLPNGTLRIRGRVDIFKQPMVTSVVGGTGAYAGARGSSIARDYDSLRSLIVYQLRLP